MQQSWSIISKNRTSNCKDRESLKKTGHATILRIVVDSSESKVHRHFQLLLLPEELNQLSNVLTPQVFCKLKS